MIERVGYYLARVALICGIIIFGYMFFLIKTTVDDSELDSLIRGTIFPLFLIEMFCVFVLFIGELIRLLTFFLYGFPRSNQLVTHIGLILVSALLIILL